MKLTERQEAAKTRLGQDVCVVAGPGSGKTRVLTERIRYLIEQMGVPPKGILAITFTEKAANEIKERVEKAVGEAAEQVQVGTLHGLCFRLLREHALRAGLDPAVELWDEDESSRELRAAVEEELNAAAQNEKATLRALLNVWSPFDPVGDLCNVYRRIRGMTKELPGVPKVGRGEGLWAELVFAIEDVNKAPATTDRSKEWKIQFAAWRDATVRLSAELTWAHLEALGKLPSTGRGGAMPKGLKEPLAALKEAIAKIRPRIVETLVGPERKYLVELLQRCAVNYEERKRVAGRLDFADLEHATIRLLEENELWRETTLQPRFEHILMDEMQDTNPVQWQVVNLLRTPGSFFGVGDINQSIYGFRFAAPEQFEAYRRSVERQGWAIDELRENFRSRGEILAFAEEVTGTAKGMRTPGLVAGRKFRMESKPVTLSEFGTEEEEREHLAATIEELVGDFVVEPKDGSGLRPAVYRDIAIIARKTKTLEQISHVLAARGIPYQLSGGFGFYDAQEVLDLLNWIRILANPLDQVARAAVLRSPLFGVTDDELLRGWEPERYRRLLEWQRRSMEYRGIDFLLEALLRDTGYLKTLEDGAKANALKFVRIARRVSLDQQMNLRQLVEELESYQASSREKNAELGAAEAVSLLSVHAAKGLEFPIVFIAGARGKSASQRAALSFHPTVGLGARWKNPETGKSEPDAAETANAKIDKELDEQENARTLYVAMTRAEQRLEISWSNGRKGTEMDSMERAPQKVGWLKEGLLAGRAEPAWVDLSEPIEFDFQISPLEPAGLEELDPMDEEDAGPTVITPTAVVTYGRCPRQYYLEHEAKISPWVGGGVEPDWARLEELDPERRDPALNRQRAREIGEATHRILSRYLRREEAEEAYELARKFDESPLGLRRDAAEEVCFEDERLLWFEQFILTARIDLWFRDAEGIVVVDYKTDNVDGVEAMERAREYEPQVALYMQALRGAYPGVPVRGYLSFLRCGLEVEVTSGPPVELLGALSEDREFRPRPSETKCRQCAYWKGACGDGWKDEEPF